MSFTSEKEVRVQLEAFRGEKGPRGETPKLSIGEVRTLDAGEAATARLSGTAEAPVLSLGIPQGRTGRDAAGNQLDNSDFTQLVAQAGICASHAGSAVIFAADRWELVSGTFTAEKGTSGYASAVLNGVICQKLEYAPQTAFAGVTTLSGTAQASYADGVFTITGEGCTLDQAYLVEGDWTQETVAVPPRKGYDAELLACMRYYVYLPSVSELSFTGYAQNRTTARFTFALCVPMRLENPTFLVKWRTTMTIYPDMIVPDSIDSVKTTSNLCCMVLTAAGLTENAMLMLKPNAVIELNCDL